MDWNFQKVTVGREICESGVWNPNEFMASKIEIGQPFVIRNLHFGLQVPLCYSGQLFTFTK